MQASNGICADDSAFGPGSTCRDTDFTIKFEQSILSLLPSSVFVLLAIARLNHLRTKPRRLRQVVDVLGGLKSVFSLLSVGAAAAAVGLWPAVDGLPSTTVPAAAMAFVSSVFICATSLAEHQRALAPSTLLGFYNLAVVLFGCAELRSLGLVGLQTEAAFKAKALSIGAVLALLGLEIVDKRRLLKDEYKAMPGQVTTSFYLKAFFPHLWRLLYTGCKRRLTVDDLKGIPANIRAAPARARLERALRAGNQASSTYLVKALYHAFSDTMLAPFAPRILLLLATYGQVYLVRDLTALLSDRSIPDSRGWALVGAFIIIYGVLPFVTQSYWEKVYNVTVQVRAALVGAIFAKALNLSSTAAREVGQGAATTYMSVDVERVLQGFELTWELFVSVLSIGLACALLWEQVRWAMFSPLFVIVLFLSVTSTFGPAIGRAQTKWMASIDARIKLLSSVLHQLSPIKLSSYERPLIGKISALRHVETNALRGYYNLIGVVAALSNVGSSFSGLAALGVYAIMLHTEVATEPLNVSKVFTVLTIVQLLSAPINVIGQGLPFVLGSYSSLKRLQGFLVLPEKASQASEADSPDADPKEAEAAGEKSAAQLAPDLVEAQGASFGWDETTPMLKDLTFRLEPGQLHMIVGPVASGKTTLLMSLLSETILQDGSFAIGARKRAYASQRAFIFTGTLRENILLDQPYDPARFARVVSACGLERDLAKLSQGENTRLGEKGLTLSGGQQQRIGLARAVYDGNSDLFLLDDVFSALDGHVEAEVFEGLFGPDGLLVGKTTVLVTHAIHRLPSAHRIIVLESGSISHFCSFAELQGHDLALIKSVREEAKQAEADPAGKVAKDAFEAQEGEADEEEDEEMSWSESSKLGAYRFFVRSAGPRNVLLSAVLLLSYPAVNMGLQGYLKALSTSGSISGAWFGGYAGFCAASALTLTAAFWHFTAVISTGSSRVIHRAELEGLFSTAPSYIQRHPVGKLLNRFSADIQQCDFAFPLAFLNCVVTLGETIGALVFVFIATPWLALAIPVLVPVYYLILRVYLATSKQLIRLEAGSKSPLYTAFSTAVSGLTTIRAFRSGEFFDAVALDLLDKSQGPFFFRFSGQNFLAGMLTWVTSILAIGLAVVAVATRSSTSAGFVGVALSQMTSLGQQLTHLLQAYAQMENGAVSVERIREFTQLPPEEPPFQNIAQRKPLGPDWPSSGEVRFVDLSARYREDLPFALNGLNIVIRGGERVGVCGRTGSGKSSTLLALFRALDQGLISGRIEIDGVDIATIPLESLRSSMSVVPQAPFVWCATIRDNLNIEGLLSDDEIWTALRSVQMHEAISALPDKLDTIIADEETFSRGQGQLICLARVLLRKRRIVLLDESTASMDHETDVAIRRVVETELDGVTLISIAHRVSSVMGFDKILVLEDGAAVEFASPASLLADPTSRFARLAASQGITAASLQPSSLD